MATAEPIELIFHLEVWLDRVEPPVRRRLEVPADLTLADLHRLIQAAFGWTNSHLHQFEDRRHERCFGDPGMDEDAPRTMIDERTVCVAEVLGELGEVLEYTYDFGDDWRHGILLHGISFPESGVTYPRCSAGARRGPPEDCGGVSAFIELAELLRHPKRKDPEGLRRRYGRIDFEEFSLEETDRAIRRLFRPAAAPRRAAKRPKA